MFKFFLSLLACLLVVGACEKRVSVNRASKSTASRSAAAIKAETDKAASDVSLSARPPVEEAIETETALLPPPEGSADEILSQKKAGLERIRNDGSSTKERAAAIFLKGRHAVTQGRFEEAQAHYLDACQLGHAEACHKFGWHEQSQGHVANARQFYKIACNGGISKSCNNLGLQMERAGKHEAALDLYAQACLESHSVSCENLKRLREHHLKQR